MVGISQGIKAVDRPADSHLVVRPAGYENQTLPILLWIYGGGLTVGSTADPQYNISGIVQAGSASNQPFIGVSINYRLGVWGFLSSPVVSAEGNLNAGLLDQRLAIRWVNENIAAFGGDPNRITLWGESAGAQSISLHLHSYDGHNDNLYHAAILESGTAVGASLNTLPFYQSSYENLTRTVGCWTSSGWTTASQLTCLRNLTSEQLFNSNYTVVWNPVVDGTFLTAYPSQLAPQHKFVKIPLLLGANTDEGISFSLPNVNTSQDIFNNLLYWRNYELSPPSIRQLLELYPNDPVNEPPYDYRNDATFPSKGLAWRRGAAIGGDLVMIAGRRKYAELYVEAGVKDVYSYRFDTPLWNASSPVGIKHFDNVMFSFQNISGAMGPLPKYQYYRDFSTAVGRAYASFVRSYQPNGAANSGAAGYGAQGKNVTGLPYWPRYELDTPKNIVLNASGSWVEDDTFRKEGIAFMNTIDRELAA